MVLQHTAEDLCCNSTLQLIFLSRVHDLVVLHPSHVDCPLSEGLTLHVNAILADETVTSLATSDNALPGSLSVFLGVGSIELIGDSCLSHLGRL